MAKKNQVTEAQIASLKEEIEKLRNENHNLKRRVKRMEERKAAEKSERLEAQAQRMRRTEEVTMGSMDEIKKTNGCGSGQQVIGSDGLGDAEGYRFKEEIIKAAMLLYIYSSNSLRAVEKSMEVFNFVFPFLGLNVPSYVTVRDWVLKAGLDTYAHRCKSLPVDEAYAIVMDESITIIESSFSYFKERKSDNRMYGVTGFVMILPLHTKLSTLESARGFDFKGCLECTHSTDLKAWGRQNLPENLAAKRVRILRNAA